MVRFLYNRPLYPCQIHNQQKPVKRGLCKECNEETRVSEANPHGTRNSDPQKQ